MIPGHESGTEGNAVMFHYRADTEFVTAMKTDRHAAILSGNAMESWF